jgi:hypothetical protein
VKTFKSQALVLAIASLLAVSAHAQSGDKVSVGAIRSIVNPEVRVDDSFNRSTDIRTRIATDNRRIVEDSFNRMTETNTNTNTTVDASRTTEDSFNTRVDAQTVAPRIRTNESIATLDTQSASNGASMSGPTQYGSQGGFSLNMGGGQPAGAQGGKYWSPASTSQAYDLSQGNAVEVDGDNYGLIRAQNSLNLGGSQINDSDLGNKQFIPAGDQLQSQGVSQEKRSATQTNSNDVIATSVSK